MTSEIEAATESRSWLYHSTFPAGWTPAPLYSLATWVNGLAFRDIQFSKTGKPVIKIAEIKGGITRQTKFTTETFDEKVRVRQGDMLFSWSGQPETSIDVFRWDGPEGWLNQHVFKLTAGEKLLPDFLFYLLRYLKPNFVAIAKNKQTTGLGHVTKRDLERMSVAYPTKDDQREIVAILGAIDGRIDALRRINATLEEMAKALFQSWFVDFDPVRAKAAGREPAGISADLATLFPPNFQESEIAEIPFGWTTVGLDQIARFLNGLALQKYPLVDSNTLPIIKIAQLRKGDTMGADECDAKIPSEYVVSDGDVLFSWSGSLEVEIWCGGRGALNQHLFKVTSSDFPKWFYYFWTRHHLDWFRRIAASKATTMGHIQRKHLEDAKVVVPPKALLDAFSPFIQPLLDQIVNNRTQSRTLAAARETLLSRLMSGELSPMQSAKEVEHV